MATDYDKLTREELIEVLDKMEREYVQATGAVENMRLIIAATENQLTAARLGEQKLARELRDCRELKTITLKVSTSLARAWLDMIDYLND